MRSLARPPCARAPPSRLIRRKSLQRGSVRTPLYPLWSPVSGARNRYPWRNEMASAAGTQTAPVIADEALLNMVVEPEKRLGVDRYFTIPGRDPFEEIEWEIRDAFIPGKDKPVFEQKGVEFPKFWSQTATNIVAQKYFR